VGRREERRGWEDEEEAEARGGRKEKRESRDGRRKRSRTHTLQATDTSSFTSIQRSDEKRTPPSLRCPTCFSKKKKAQDSLLFPLLVRQPMVGLEA